MTSIKFPRKDFESSIESKITKEIEEKISLFGTPLESITEEEIEVEVFPNRPDLISLQGFIRSFKTFLGKSKEFKQYQVNKPKENYEVMIEKSVKEVRPFTACAIVSNLELNDTKIKQIIDLQEKLHFTIGRNRKKVAIGIYPLEKVNLPIKYRALPPEKIKFIPLEETKELTAQQILNRHPKGKDFAHLLKSQDLFPIFSDAKGKILSMPPIINSEETGKVTAQTKDVFIECSGTHLLTLEKTLNIIVTTLADMGGKIYAMALNYEKEKMITPNLSPEKMKISLENTNKLLGLNLKENDLEKLLSKMGIAYKNKTASIPAWRTDILHEVDLIEDVAIAFGYDKFESEIPNIATIGEESEKEKLKTKLKESLIGLGLTEILTYHLIKSHEADLFQLKEKIEVENSKTEYKFLRPNLLIPTLRIFSENKDHDYPQETFEIGTVFSLDKNSETGIKETENLIVALSPANFTKIKQILDYLSQTFNFKYELKESPSAQLIDGRTASISINGKEIGYLGEVHPETLQKWTIKMPLAVLEISFDNL